MCDSERTYSEGHKPLCLSLIRTALLYIPSALVAVRGPQQLSRNVAVLHHAISDGNEDIVKLFLDNG